MDALPDAARSAAEVIVQRGHRNAYDRAFRTAGARIVEVGYPWIEGVGLTYEWQLEAGITERTAAIAHFPLAEAEGIPLARVCEIAAAHGVPVIVDAAAELPPASNLRRYLDEGAALVAFSGGKAIRGPQGSGILAGRRELIESVRLQTLDMDIDVEAWIAREGAEPPHHGLGRSMKIGKEQIVGVVTALQEFLARDHDAEAAEHCALARVGRRNASRRWQARVAGDCTSTRASSSRSGASAPAPPPSVSPRACLRSSFPTLRSPAASWWSRRRRSRPTTGRTSRRRSAASGRSSTDDGWTLAGATVVDGTGAEPRTANVVIEDDRIAAVDGSERRGTVIDATGLVAAPGFVDIHSHVDWIVPLADGPGSARAERPAGDHDRGRRQLRHLAGAARGRLSAAARSSGCRSSASSRRARLELADARRVPARDRAARACP